MSDLCRICYRNPLQILAAVLTMHRLGLTAPRTGFEARARFRPVPKSEEQDFVCWFCAAHAARMFGIIL